MKTSKRFNNAIKKLYTAFHQDRLNPEDCKQCAVGNILDQSDQWKHLTDVHGSLKLNYLGRIHQSFGRQFNGYSPLELLQIEAAFLKGCGYKVSSKLRLFKPDNINKEVLFKGLSEVVAHLCYLDNMPNVMDCDQLFNKAMNLSEPLKSY